MKAEITESFRIREEDGIQRAYEVGDIASGSTAEWAITHGYGVAAPEEPASKDGEQTSQKAAPAPDNKAARPAKNKDAE